MSPNGSASTKPFPLLPALAVTAAGVAAMVGGAGALVFRPGLGLRAQIAIGTLLLALPALAALALRPGWWPGVRGLRTMAGRTIGLSLLLGAALWLASAGLMEVQSLVLPPPSEYLDAFRAIHRALAPTGPLDALVSVLVIAVLPGVCEELVIRGVLLPSLARGLSGPLPAEDPGPNPPSTRLAPGAWIAIALSALVFAVIHFDPIRFLFTLVLGLVFGYVRLRAGSLWPSVLAHAALNTLTFAIAPFVDDPTQPYTPSPALGVACLLAGSALSWPLLRAVAPSRR
jgi:membrane protease YdiL (CAAX protease family)